MDTPKKIHTWEASGLGRAPFRCVAVIETPCQSLLESNPWAFNSAWAEAQQSANVFGVTLASCYACGQCLRINCVIRDADHKHFVVGCDCVRKTGDAGLISRIQLEERRKNKARRAAEQQARWEAEAPIRKAREDEQARIRAAQEAAQEATRIQMAAENAWLINVLTSASRYDGDFCSSVANSLLQKRPSDLSNRCLDIVRDIYAKNTGGRSGSKSYLTACDVFDSRVGMPFNA